MPEQETNTLSVKCVYRTRENCLAGENPCPLYGIGRGINILQIRIAQRRASIDNPTARARLNQELKIIIGIAWLRKALVPICIKYQRRGMS